MNLRDAVEGKEYVVRQIDTEDEDLNAFLFSLGCYSGEHITVAVSYTHLTLPTIDDV